MKNLRNKRHCCSKLSNDDEIPTQDVDNLMYKINSMNEEKPNEEYIARLYDLPFTLETSEVKNVRLIENVLVYPEVNRPSCFKKSDEHKGKKKVSFLAVTEEKGNQIDICPHHKIKTLRTSSHQFPPLEKVQKEVNILCEKQVQYNNKGTDGEETASQKTIQNSPPTTEAENNYSVDEYGKNEVHNQPNVINKDNFDNKYSDAVSEYSDTTETRSESLSQTKANPYILEKQQFNVYYDNLNEKNAQVVVKNVLSSVQNKRPQSRKDSKIILFRELPDVSNLLTAFKLMLDFNLNKSHLCKNVEINNLQLKKIRSSEDVKVVTLLKSIYAVVYLLIFTAFNLEYTCVYN